MENPYSLDSMLDVIIRNNSIARSYGKTDRDSFLSQTLRIPSNEENIYARPIMRAKSEYCLPTSSTSSPKSGKIAFLFSFIKLFDESLKIVTITGIEVFYSPFT